MTKFKKGDRVRRITAPGGGQALGDESVVEDFSESNHTVMLGSRWRSAEYYELVGPKWSDVEAGDKVTFRVQETGEEFTTTATVGDSRRAATLGLRLGLGLPTNRWELISIEKPKPVPPQTPGSVIMILHPAGYRTGGDPEDSFPMFRLGIPSPGPDGVAREWISDRGTYWSDKSVQNGYDGAGFRVLYDAGEED